MFALALQQGTKTTSGQRQHYVMALRDYCGRMADAMEAEVARRSFPNSFGMSVVPQVPSFPVMPPMSSQDSRLLMSQLGNFSSQQ